VISVLIAACLSLNPPALRFTELTDVPSKFRPMHLSGRTLYDEELLEQVAKADLSSPSSLGNGVVVSGYLDRKAIGLRVESGEVVVQPEGWLIARMTLSSILFQQKGKWMVAATGKVDRTFELPEDVLDSQVLITNSGDVWAGVYSDRRGYELLHGTERGLAAVGGVELSHEYAFIPSMEYGGGVLGMLKTVRLSNPEQGSFSSSFVTQLGPVRRYVPALATRTGIVKLGMPTSKRLKPDEVYPSGAEIEPIWHRGSESLWLADLQGHDIENRWYELFLLRDGKWSSILTAKSISYWSDTSEGTCVLRVDDKYLKNW